MLHLTSGPARATIDPGVGAGMVALTWGDIAILSTGAGRADGPFAQGMNLLLPFSNRISRPFAFGGATYALPINLPGEPFPIHGDAFQVPWQVDELTADSATLVVQAGQGPYRYDARVTYRLAADGLQANVLITNRAAITLPYGGGFHPWFPRHPTTQMQFAALGHWPEDARHLPATLEPVPAPPD